MAYHVEFAERTARDLATLYLEKNAAESQASSRWYNGPEEAVYALASYPDRCPVAPEARKLRRNCGSCSTARSLTFIASFMKSMNADRRSGYSRFVAAQGGRLRRPMLNEPRNCSPRVKVNEKMVRL